MKKARILLSAVTVMAVVSGALAFKPAKFAQRDIFCPINTPAANKCPLQNFSKTDRGAGVANFGCTDPNTGNPLGFAYTATTVVSGSTLCVTTATVPSTLVYNTISQ